MITLRIFCFLLMVLFGWFALNSYTEHMPGIALGCLAFALLMGSVVVFGWWMP